MTETPFDPTATQPRGKGAAAGDDTPPPDAGKRGKSNSVKGGALLAFLERIERVREAKAEWADDEKAIFAEAKANGYDTKVMRRALKVRAMRPGDREEADAMLDLYLSAVGMKSDLPLFRSVGAMASDAMGREAIVGALGGLVPANGTVTFTGSGASIRLVRDDKGELQVTDYDPDAERREREARDADPMSGAIETDRRKEADAPDVDEVGARELGAQAAQDRAPVISNPFPWNDKRRRAWDAGWRSVAGDGMGPSEDD